MIDTRTETEEALFRAGLVDGPSADLLRRGHFVRQSGSHGEVRLDVQPLLDTPGRLQRVAQALAEKLRGHVTDVVCSPAGRDVRLAQAVAAMLDRPFVPPEAWTVVAGVRAAVVDDVIETGASARGAVRGLRSAGATVAAIGVLVARAPVVLPVNAFGGLPVERLASLEWSLWPAVSCPLCAAGRPIDDAR
jgi:orotate phosphoribosyltransferase